MNKSETTDEMARRYRELQRRAMDAEAELASLRRAIIARVLYEGSTPPRAVKTKALLGEEFELRVSQPVEVSVDTRMALRIRAACAKSGAAKLFARLFRKTESYILAAGAQKLINGTLPAKAPRGLRGLFARAIHVRNLPASLEVRERKNEREAAA